MKTNNFNIIPSQTASLSANGTAVDASFVTTCSAQIVASGSATGTLKLQASNDAIFPPNVPTHWNDITSATVSVSGAGSYMILKTDICYDWIRAVYSSTATGAQTVAPIADTGVRQVQTVATVADVAASLNSKFFNVSSVNQSTKAQKNFYVWYNVSSGGVDPAIPGKTGVEVAISSGDSANTVATATRAALNALSGDFVASGSTNQVIITNVAPGLVTAASQGTASTGFTITNTTPGVASNLNSKYFLLYSEGNAIAYYVWMNVDSIGTDPAVAGKTGIEIDFAAHASAATIGAAIAAAVALANSSSDFTTAGTTTVTITNQAAGPFTAASDVNTGFSFAITAGGGTITANLKTLGF